VEAGLLASLELSCTPLKLLLGLPDLLLHRLHRLRHGGVAGVQFVLDLFLCSYRGLLRLFHALYPTAEIEDQEERGKNIDTCDGQNNIAQHVGTAVPLRDVILLRHGSSLIELGQLLWIV